MDPLAADRARAAEQVAALVAASEDSNADDEHDPEGATIGFERAQLTAVLAAARQRLSEIDAAIARHETGGYGTCARCGAPIGAERLVALPATTLCVECARTFSRR